MTKSTIVTILLIFGLTLNNAFATKDFNSSKRNTSSFKVNIKQSEKKAN